MVRKIAPQDFKRSKLIKARKEKNLSQQQFAIAIGVSRSFYNQIENGVRNPRFETAEKISMILDLDVREWR